MNNTKNNGHQQGCDIRALKTVDRVFQDIAIAHNSHDSASVSCSVVADGERMIKNMGSSITSAPSSGMPSSPLGVLAGAGELPLTLLRAVQGRTVYVAGLRGVTDLQTLAYSPNHRIFAMGQVGALVTYWRAHGVKEVVCVGSVPRPAWHTLRPDGLGMVLLARLGLRWCGDDAVLRIIKEFFMQQGFHVLAPQTVLPSFLPTHQGAYTASQPMVAEHEDIAYGVRLLEALGTWDFGQGVAVAGGVVLAVEAAEGTDACIARAGMLARGLGHNACEESKDNTDNRANLATAHIRPVYIKRAKQGQSKVMDLPTIGVHTITQLHHAGFAGLAIQAGHTVWADPVDRVAQAADEAGLWLWAVP